jgi:hypothetical protein
MIWCLAVVLGVFPLASNIPVVIVLVDDHDICWVDLRLCPILRIPCISMNREGTTVWLALRVHSRWVDQENAIEMVSGALCVCVCFVLCAGTFCFVCADSAVLLFVFFNVDCLCHCVYAWGRFWFGKKEGALLSARCVQCRCRRLMHNHSAPQPQPPYCKSQHPLTSQKARLVTCPAHVRSTGPRAHRPSM